jgi:hypothetical protein
LKILVLVGTRALARNKIHRVLSSIEYSVSRVTSSKKERVPDCLKLATSRVANTELDSYEILISKKDYILEDKFTGLFRVSA